MSTQKHRIKDPVKARRSVESIYAEAIISKACSWKIEFLSGGCGSFSVPELVEITKNVCKITKQKQWLNIGTLSKQEIKQFLPYIQGVCGTVECINKKIRNEVCPSKPLKPIIRMLKACDELGLKKTITIIIGLGETEKDIPDLINFIRKYKLDKITFYALNPHEGTVFTKGPETSYYVKWIKAVRKEFPKIEIVAGSWVNRVKEIHELLEAGADSITKFPSIKLFNSRFAQQIEKEIKTAGRTFKGTLTKLPNIDWNKEVDKYNLTNKKIIKNKIKQYIKQMSR